MNKSTEIDIPYGFKLLENRSYFGNLIGPIYYKDEDHQQVFGFMSSQKHINLGGYVHGGMLSSFADIIMGQFSNRNYGNLMVTINMSIDFISLAKKNVWITGKSYLAKEDDNFVFLECVVEANKKTILFTTGVFKLIKHNNQKKKKVKYD